MINWETVSDADSEELEELKSYLFEENIRLENERRRLKDETLFFSRKMEILQAGFQQLDADRRHFEKERELFWKERAMLRDNLPRYERGQLSSDIASVLFRSTDNLLTIRKRYKDLMKIFHPDNLCGDAELVQLINQEYEKKKNEM